MRSLLFFLPHFLIRIPRTVHAGATAAAAASCCSGVVTFLSRPSRVLQPGLTCANLLSRAFADALSLPLSLLHGCSDAALSPWELVREREQRESKRKGQRAGARETERRLIDRITRRAGASGIFILLVFSPPSPSLACAAHTRRQRRYVTSISTFLSGGDDDFLPSPYVRPYRFTTRALLQILFSCKWRRRRRLRTRWLRGCRIYLNSSRSRVHTCVRENSTDFHATRLRRKSTYFSIFGTPVCHASVEFFSCPVPASFLSLTLVAFFPWHPRLSRIAERGKKWPRPRVLGAAKFFGYSFFAESASRAAAGAWISQKYFANVHWPACEKKRGRASAGS